MDIVQGTGAVIGAIGETALEAAENGIIAEFPVLGMWPLKQIWEFFVERYAQKAIAELKKGSAAYEIQIIDHKQAEDAKASKNQLQKVQDDPNSTPEQQEAAYEDFKKKYGDLIRVRVATPP